MMYLSFMTISSNENATPLVEKWPKRGGNFCSKTLTASNLTLCQFYAFHFLTHFIPLCSRYPCTLLATAFFSVMLKNFWNQIWIPHAITYMASMSRSRYQAICGLIWRFSKLIHYFFIFNQIFPTKKHNTR